MLEGVVGACENSLLIDSTYLGMMEIRSSPEREDEEKILKERR